MQHCMLLDAWQDHLTYPVLRRKVKLDRGALYGDEGSEKKVDLRWRQGKGT
jgi:hypothetical protein